MARRRAAPSSQADRGVDDTAISLVPTALLPWGSDGEWLPVQERRRRHRLLDAWLEVRGLTADADRSALLDHSRQAHGLPHPTDPRTRMHRQERTDAY